MISTYNMYWYSQQGVRKRICWYVHRYVLNKMTWMVRIYSMVVTDDLVPVWQMPSRRWLAWLSYVVFTLIYRYVWICSHLIKLCLSNRFQAGFGLRVLEYFVPWFQIQFKNRTPAGMLGCSRWWYSLSSSVTRSVVYMGCRFIWLQLSWTAATLYIRRHDDVIKWKYFPRFILVDHQR